MKEKQRYEKLVRFIYFDSLWINYKSIFVNINKFVDAFWVEQTKLSQSLVFAPLIHCSLYRIYKTYVNNVQRLFGEKTMQRTSFYWKSCEHKIVLSGNLVLDIFHQTKYVCFFFCENVIANSYMFVVIKQQNASCYKWFHWNSTQNNCCDQGIN